MQPRLAQLASILGARPRAAVSSSASGKLAGDRQLPAGQTRWSDPHPGRQRLLFQAWVYSSAVERLTADQQVPGSNPGVPFSYFALHVWRVFRWTSKRLRQKGKGRPGRAGVNCP